MGFIVPFSFCRICLKFFTIKAFLEIAHNGSSSISLSGRRLRHYLIQSSCYRWGNGGTPWLFQGVLRYQMAELTLESQAEAAPFWPFQLSLTCEESAGICPLSCVAFQTPRPRTWAGKLCGLEGVSRLQTTLFFSFRKVWRHTKHNSSLIF